MKLSSILSKAREIAGYERYKYRVDHCPQKIIDLIWQREYGYKIDWNNPKDLNEKIQWLICFGDTSNWPLLADKYRVREYVAKKGLSELLPELYGVWSDARDIDFTKLPEKFILRCNHDSGSTYIIDQSTEYDKEAIIIDLNKHLKKKYGYAFCEPHYNLIKPRVIAQEFLNSNTDSFSTQLVDYRVWCFHGKPYSIWVDYYPDNYRETHHKNIDVYDLNWNHHPEFESFSKRYQDGGGIVPRPENLSEMLDAAQILSENLPEARIDFYIVNGQLYFGEITLTSNRGRITHFTKEYLLELGNQIKLPL